MRAAETAPGRAKRHPGAAPSRVRCAQAAPREGDEEAVGGNIDVLADLEPWAERRRHPRVPVELPVRLSTIDPEIDPRTGRPYFRASREMCANLSRGGLFIRTARPDLARAGGC